MSGEVLAFLTGCIAQFWHIFNGWYVPGTNVTPAGWAMFLLSAGVLFRFLKKLGFGSASISDLKRGANMASNDESGDN